MKRASVQQASLACAILFAVAFSSVCLGDDTVGLNPGDKAPDFTLKNQDGKDVKLSDLLEKGNVALVFYRSADW